MQEERTARQVARKALQELNLLLEKKKGQNRLILESTVVDALAKERPTTEQALDSLQVSKFSANTRTTYGHFIIETLRKVSGQSFRHLSALIRLAFASAAAKDQAISNASISCLAALDGLRMCTVGLLSVDSPCGLPVSPGTGDNMS